MGLDTARDGQFTQCSGNSSCLPAQPAFPLRTREMPVWAVHKARDTPTPPRCEHPRPHCPKAAAWEGQMPVVR